MTDKLKIRRVAVSNYALLVGSHRYTVLQKASKRNGLRWVGCRGFCAVFVLCLLFVCRKIVAWGLATIFLFCPAGRWTEIGINLFDKLRHKKGCVDDLRKLRSATEQFWPFFLKLAAKNKLATLTDNVLPSLPLGWVGGRSGGEGHGGKCALQVGRSPTAVGGYSWKLTHRLNRPIICVSKDEKPFFRAKTTYKTTHRMAHGDNLV